jgi:hypothetical protein
MYNRPIAFRRIAKNFEMEAEEAPRPRATKSEDHFQN